MTRTESGLVGTLLDRRYRVDGLLAHGGMSSVFRGMDTRLDRPVAIKIMDSRFADDRTFVERFEREARAAAKLHHPNVVSVHDQGFDTSTGPEERHAFLVMELVDGGTLRDLLDQHGRLEPPLAAAIAEHVLSALSAAHAAGLVHRDVKPENVLIGRGGTTTGGVVKVADFGLVRAVAGAGSTSSSVILGTVAYLSPEQVTTGSATVRGDVYSTGILLYEMLTGTVPYTADTALSVAYRHVNDDVPAPSTIVPGLPPALDELVLRATRRDADARPADASAFLSELRRVRTELGIGPVAVPVPATASVESDNETAETDVERTMPAIPVASATAGPRGTQALLTPAAPPPDEPPAPPVSPPTSRARGLWIALWVVAALLFTGGLGAGVWWFTAGRWVDVPKVAGMDRPQAERVLRDAELTPTVAERRHDNVPTGTVIGSEPGTGARALRGDQVTILLSLGKPVVPDIAPGTAVAQAEQALRAVSLKPQLDPGADQYHADVAAGAVIGADPRAGTQLGVGSAVTLVLSKGPPPTPVPTLTGRPRDDAFAALEAAGFEPYDAGEEFSAEVPAGHVVRTEPGAGATSPDMRVGVFVSNAVEVPSVTGRSAEAATKILTEAGLAPHGTEGHSPNLSFVIGQDPGPGSRVPKGTAVNLTVVP